MYDMSITRLLSTIGAASAFALYSFGISQASAQTIPVNQQGIIQINAKNTFNQYKIQKGDTLFGIARRLNTSIEDLVLDNGIKDPNKIFVGDILLYSDASNDQRDYLDNLHRYTSIRELIGEIESKNNIPNDLLHLVVLVESEGRSRDRFETEFKQKHVDYGKSRFDKNQHYLSVFNALRKENLELTEEKFKKQLATSVGPAQVLYCTAIDLGFRGSIDELRTIECNLDYAAKMLVKQSNETDFQWEKVLTAYNTNSVNGKPTKNHLARGKFYKKLLKDKLSQENR